MRKQDKKLVFLLIALILIIIICINIFSKLVKNEEQEETQNGYKDEHLIVEYEKRGKYEPSVINYDYTSLRDDEILAIDNMIDYVLEIINSKNYSKLYYMLDVNYRGVKFRTLEEFQKYFETEYKNDEYIALSYKISNAACYITLTTNDALDSEIYKEIKVKNYTSTDGAQIYFEDINEIYVAETVEYISGVSLKMQYIVEYNDKITAIFEVSNKNSKETEIALKNFNLVTITNNTQTTSTDSEIIKLASNGKTQVEINFDNPNRLYILPSYIAFDIDVNGENQRVESSLKYEDVE